MQAAISKTNIKVFQKAYKSSPTNKLSRNALTRTSMLDVAMDWDAFRKVDHTYSHTIPNEIKKTLFWGLFMTKNMTKKKPLILGAFNYGSNI